MIADGLSNGCKGVRVSLTTFGLGLDLAGVLLLTASAVGWHRSDGSQSIYSWITEGPPRRWLQRAGWDPERVRVRVFRVGWLAIIAGFSLQLLASL